MVKNQLIRWHAKLEKLLKKYLIFKKGFEKNLFCDKIYSSESELIDWEKFPPISLKDFQEMFKDIYLEKDKRDYSAEDMIIHMVEELTLLARWVRKEQMFSNLIPPQESIARFFAWLCGFCNFVSIDLEEAIFQKYPGYCPYCKRSENCMCITFTQEMTSQQKHFLLEEKENQKTMPRELKEWQEMFRKIYGRINRLQTIIQILLHLYEEISEFSRAWRLREKEKEEVKKEIADIFAWLCALCNKLNIDLQEIVKKRYPGVCDVCGKRPCECLKV